MKYFIPLIVFLCINASANKMTLVVDEYGQLGREELGIVFRPALRKQGWFYFAAGNAMEVCPKLVNAKKVIGYEEGYCKNHDPIYPKECDHVKVFIITEYINE